VTTFVARREILPPAQIKLWPSLAAAAELGFVLYGGTAIALRLGHRQSVDFDFFSERPLDKDELHRVFGFLADSQVIQDERNTLCVLVPSSDGAHSFVKVSFFGGIGFGRVGAPQWTDDRTLLVAAIDDLMATKIKVLLQRVEAKDYLDVAALIVAGVSLARGLSCAQVLFGKSFQPHEALKALVFFEGGDLHDVSVRDRKVLIDAVAEVRRLPEVAIVSRTLGCG